MTYAELKADIADTLNRTDLTAKMPGWIKMAEAEINRRLRVPLMEEFYEGLTDGGQLTLPDGTQTVLNIEVSGGSGYPLKALSRTQLDGLSAASGQPNYYSVQGLQVLLYPNPGTVTLAMRLHVSPDALTDDADTHDVLSAYPDLYLYAALQHGAIYLKEPDNIAIYSGLFEKALKTANKSGRDIRTARPTLALHGTPNVAHRR